MELFRNTSISGCVQERGKILRRNGQVAVLV